MEIYGSIENYDIIYNSAMIMGYFSKEEMEKLHITASYYDKNEKEYKKEIIEINCKEAKNMKFEQIV